MKVTSLAITGSNFANKYHTIIGSVQFPSALTHGQKTTRNFRHLYFYLICTSVSLLLHICTTQQPAT